MTKRKRKKTNGFPRRLLALMLCCFCLMAAMPVSAFALDAEPSPATEETAAQEQTEGTKVGAVAAAADTPTPTAPEGASEGTSAAAEVTTTPEATPQAKAETTPSAEGDASAETAGTGDAQAAATPGVTETPEATEALEATAAPEETGESAEAPVTEELAEMDAAAADKDNSVTAAAQALYKQAMAAKSGQAIFELIGDDANYEAASVLTVEQVEKIREYANTLEDDGYQEPLVQMLDELLLALGEEVDTEISIDTAAGKGDIDPGYYSGSVPVYWDTVTSLDTGGSSAGGTNVSAVSLGSKAVTYGNASSTSWSGGTTLSAYFPNASRNNMKDATMSITAAAGYYVTGVLVACAPSGGNSRMTPFHCSTWRNDREFIESFNLTDSSYANGQYTLSFSINSRYFSHNGNTSPYAYFILIKVAAVPEPLFVEYDYGNVADFLTVDENSAFYSPTWTVKNASNNYGTGSVYTDDTQFAYEYGSSISVIANWTHTANTISDAALAEAKAAGYQFAGWSATWYNNCTRENVKNAHNDNWTFAFAKVYLTGTLQPGANVQLPTHVRLVALWEKLPEPTEYNLTVKKTLSGNMYNEADKFTFTVTYGDKTETFALGKDETKTIVVPVEAAVSVTENAGDYTYSLGAVTPNTLAYTAGDSGISFTMPKSDVTVTVNNRLDITIDTGVILDTLPYLLILAVVIAGAVLLIGARRHRNDDH